MFHTILIILELTIGFIEFLMHTINTQGDRKYIQTVQSHKIYNKLPYRSVGLTVGFFVIKKQK